jgi:hypothetical protein
MRFRVLFKLVEYKDALAKLPHVVLACIILHNLLLLDRAPLNPSQADYIADVIREAKIRMNTEKKIRRHAIQSRFTFHHYSGNSKAVGRMRRQVFKLIMTALGFLAPGAPVPVASKRRRVDGSA